MRKYGGRPHWAKVLDACISVIYDDGGNSHTFA